MGKAKKIIIITAAVMLTAAVVGGTVGLIKSKQNKPTTPEHVHVKVIDNNVDPTCTNTGLTKGAHCISCGAILTEQTVIAALGHTEVVDKGVIATCTTTGFTDGKHCSVCGEITVERQTVPLIPHNYVNGVCIMCDMDDPSATLDTNAFYLVGSMNGWKWTSDRYKFYSVATDRPNITSQYKLTVSLDENAEVKVWKGNDDWTYNNYETDWDYATRGENLTITQSGTYNFYLKFYSDGGNSVYVEKIN